MVAVFAGTWALGVLATLLRLYCRRLTKSRLWLDDWLIIISLVCETRALFHRRLVYILYGDTRLTTLTVLFRRFHV